MTNQIPETIAQEIADYVDAELHTDYSGRNMYGRECIGLSTDIGGWDLLSRLHDYRTGFEPGDDEFEEVTALIETQPREDSLGMGTIFYWPSTEVVNSK